MGQIEWFMYQGPVANCCRCRSKATMVLVMAGIHQNTYCGEHAVTNNA